jgi:hypothetical protein
MPRLAALLLSLCVAGPALPNDRFKLGAQPRLYFVHTTIKKTFGLDGEWSRQVSRWAPPVSAFAVESVIFGRGAGAERTLELVDPVALVKERLAERLQKELELSNVSVLPDGLDADALAAFREANKTGALVVVTTRYWGLDDYRAKYSADVKITDLADSRPIVSSACPNTVSNTDDSSVTRDPALVRELALANNGEAINAAFRDAAERCAGQIAYRIVDRKK